MHGHVMIKCPNTGALVDTGFGMDREFFEAAPLKDNTMRCPACGVLHAWGKPAVYFREDALVAALR
jgi:hypothetical protein